MVAVQPNPPKYEALQWHAGDDPWVTLPFVANWDNERQNWITGEDGSLVNISRYVGPWPDGTWFVSQPYWGDFPGWNTEGIVFPTGTVGVNEVGPDGNFAFSPVA